MKTVEIINANDEGIKKLDFSKPLLLKKWAVKWPALQKWNKEFLCGNYGELVIKTVSSAGSVHYKDFSVKEYFSYLEKPDHNLYYINSWVIEDKAGDLLNDYTTPEYFKCWTNHFKDELRPKLKWLYIGPEKSGSPLHVDILNTCAWNAVFRGEKRWHFFSPDDARFLYDNSVDSFNPDYNKYPLFRMANAFTCIQEPGDIVYTPSRWPHQVTNLSETISLTENFVNGINIDNVLNYLINNKEVDYSAYITEINKLKSLGTDI